MDKRNWLLEKLNNYKGVDAHEEAMRLEVIDFVNAHEDCFERSLKIGHITGSAWVVDHSYEFVLLTHHRKLDKWFQMGGHSDGESNTLKVAIREIAEESGLKNIKSDGSIFDIDVHVIPERGDEPAHKHYDIRFLFIANRNELLTITNESKDLKWVNLEDVVKYNPEEAMQRTVKKTEKLKFLK